MESKEVKIYSNELENRIFTIRGKQVMMDRDLAELFQVETKQLNRATKRNLDRFPERFMFQLTELEVQNFHGGTRYLPFVFTEHGITMLPSVLNSKTAINISIEIIDTFVEMRKIISENNLIDQRLKKIGTKTNRFRN